MSNQNAIHDVLSRIYENQLALEAAIMELVLSAEQHGAVEVGDNARGALHVIGENAGHIRQGLAQIKGAINPD